MSRTDKKYHIQLLLSMGLYLGFTYGSVWLLKNHDLTGYKTAVSLLPMVPLFWSYQAIIAHVRSMDELQRKIQLEAVVFSATITGFFAGAYGFMQNAGYPQLDVIWILPMLIILWGVGGFVARRRYQ